jgi:hypothetical protein
MNLADQFEDYRKRSLQTIQHQLDAADQAVAVALARRGELQAKEKRLKEESPAGENPYPVCFFDRGMYFPIVAIPPNALKRMKPSGLPASDYFRCSNPACLEEIEADHSEQSLR